MKVVPLEDLTPAIARLEGVLGALRRGEVQGFAYAVVGTDGHARVWAGGSGRLRGWSAWLLLRGAVALLARFVDDALRGCIVDE